MKTLCSVGQGRDGSICSWAKSHSYLCSRHSRYPCTAIDTWQALKTHKETRCLLETVTVFFPSSFSKVLLWVNNHFEKCAWWLQLKTYRVSFGPREARNSSGTLRPLWGRRRATDKTCSISIMLRTCQRGVISGWHWKAWHPQWWTLIWTHSVSLGTCFSWRPSLSLITLCENEMLLL